MSRTSPSGVSTDCGTYVFFASPLFTVLSVFQWLSLECIRANEILISLTYLSCARRVQAL